MKFFSLLLLFPLFLCRENKTESVRDKSDALIEETGRSKGSGTFSGGSVFDFYPTSTSGTVIHRQGYSFSYSEKFEQSEWVAYELTSADFSNRDFKRPFFVQDPKVKTQSADWRNYKKSGYDKGHLCPAADRKSSYQAYAETFFTSNITPQRHNFNDGVWNRLEQKTRYWAKKYNGVYVVTGGVLKGNLKTIGKEKVAVPDYFYKILMTKDEKKMIGFLVPHKASDLPLYQFTVSVDAIEKMTGIDFFPKLPDRKENQLEKATDYKNWSF
ncbi:MAG TPA: DNA/RNA non-specific endonuclease [Flavobacterium sp.]|uniref:DNA/RNA non-specific endonuclease n=1 Tax=Flavobacterium sp. TaxID=239 RepID=UPI002C3F49FA|nr:DNA/RNA non-specific endonuclease [Flavobacterium sp.]HSD15231.1 DNA/RNA non-specific endonuclease [Flavobacterium sp.]